MILPKDRDPASSPSAAGDAHGLRPSAPGFVAAAYAEHVLHLFESVQPSDPRPRQAIEQIRAWARGEIRRCLRPARRVAMSWLRPES